MSLNRRELLKAAIVASLAAVVPPTLSAVVSLGDRWIEYTPETWNEWSMFNVRQILTHRQYGEIEIDTVAWMMCAGRTEHEMFHVIGAANRHGKTFLKLGCHQGDIGKQTAESIAILCQQAMRELTATGVIT